MNETWYIAVEGGATRSRAALYDPQDHCHGEAEGAPCNPVAYGVPRCVQNLSALLHPMLAHCNGAPCELLLGTAGGAAAGLRQTLGAALFAALPVSRLRISTDLHPLLLAHAPDSAAMLVVAGTGSAVLSKDVQGHFRRFGGRGVLFGDVGSAHQLAVRGLRAAAVTLDGLGEATALYERFLAYLGLAHWEDVVTECSAYGKDQLADLARVVLTCAEEGDPVAQAILREEAEALAGEVAAARAGLYGGDVSIPLYAQGALVTQDNPFRIQFSAALEARGLGPVQPLQHNGPACMGAMRQVHASASWISILQRAPKTTPRESVASPTEAVSTHPPLDSLSTLGMVQRMHAADQEAVAAVGGCQEVIAALIDALTDRFDAGGRIIYLGAGTSGRLGVLDASECPPTFGVPASRVVGLIAGGETALRESGEGAEDDEAAGRADLQALHPTTNDCVIGLAASGRTPYVHAALQLARDAGALTALVCCNPRIDRASYGRYIDHILCLDTGAEVLAGSTRLKAGTATKLVLNMLSTCTLARHGLVFEGRMVGMRPLNIKLRQRAVQMVADLGGCSPEKAQTLLDAVRYEIAPAILMAQLGLTPDAAKARLDAAGGKLRQALEGA